ncbi:MAG: DOMON domain-containing protein [Bacteroidota bacterium]
MKTLVSLLATFSFLLAACQDEHSLEQELSRYGMTVSWKKEEHGIRFHMKAPTKGWICIGFNDGKGMKDSWLLMARMMNGKAELVEHFTLKPGQYHPISDLGGQEEVREVVGHEEGNYTHFSFLLPFQPASTYQRELTTGKTYDMVMAYSRDKDFQHHSMMRTSQWITF